MGGASRVGLGQAGAFGGGASHDPATDVGAIFGWWKVVGDGINSGALDGAASILVGIVDICRICAVLGGRHDEEK